MIDNAIHKATDGISDFLKLESAGGLLLAAAAVLALIFSNSPLRQAYENLLQLVAGFDRVRQSAVDGRSQRVSEPANEGVRDRL